MFCGMRARRWVTCEGPCVRAAYAQEKGGDHCGFVACLIEVVYRGGQGSSFLVTLLQHSAYWVSILHARQEWEILA